MGGNCYECGGRGCPDCTDTGGSDDAAVAESDAAFFRGQLDTIESLRAENERLRAEVAQLQGIIACALADCPGDETHGHWKQEAMTALTKQHNNESESS